MNILAHRGYWLDEQEKNTIESFHRAFSLGFGIETDIRDYCGELVVSHDIPNKDSLVIDELFKIYQQYDNKLIFALNVKSDGLQKKLLKKLQQYNINNYFVFDMSVPDGLLYLRDKFCVFTRQSEYENEASFYNEAQGVWLDEFYSHWITADIIKNHLSKQKELCIVSPDLHKRDYTNEWADYKKINELNGNDSIMLCTDHPVEAMEFFNG